MKTPEEIADAARESVDWLTRTAGMLENLGDDEWEEVEDMREALPHNLRHVAEDVRALIEAPATQAAPMFKPDNPIIRGFRDALESGEYSCGWLARLWVQLLDEGHDFTEDTDPYTAEDAAEARRILAMLSSEDADQ